MPSCYNSEDLTLEKADIVNFANLMKQPQVDQVEGFRVELRFFCKLVGEIAMARVCQVTGKRPMVGNNVSHANNKTKRRFLPNLQRRRLWVETENRWVSLRLTNAGLRTIDKNGIDAVLFEMRARGENV